MGRIIQDKNMPRQADKKAPDRNRPNRNISIRNMQQKRILDRKVPDKIPTRRISPTKRNKGKMAPDGKTILL